MKNRFHFLAIFACSLMVLAWWSCNRTAAFEFQNIEKELQTQLIMVNDGGTVTIPEGRYKFSGSLSMEGKKNVVIKGQGKDKTFLSFAGQTDGAEGIKVTNGENITISDLTVQDTKGDCIKVQKVNGLVLKNVRAEWTGEPKEENGAYGLYPVDCDRVLIDGCEAIGASDAGIYVGQSRDVVVRNCYAYHNVAGIEIENCIRADVYDNHSYQNTGGILVFDMPELPQSGRDVRVFKNLVEKNNFRNFAPEGNIVGEVIPGTGIMVLATDGVEIFDNDIKKNKSIGTTIVSYLLVKKPYKDPSFDPYPKGIYVYDNRYTSSLISFPPFDYELGMLLYWKFFFNRPDIIYDGYLDPTAVGADGKYLEEHRICIADNNGAAFVNIDAGNNFENMSRDKKEFDCTKEKLQPVTVSL